MQRYIITEGVEGYWHYHISRADKFTKSLCGKDTMQTELCWGSWGVTGHLKERYCKECYDKLRLSENHGATEYNSDKEGFTES